MTTLSRQEILKKWAPVLDAKGAPQITDNYRREVTAVLLENQEYEMGNQARVLTETTGAPIANVGGDGLALGGAGTNANMAGYDPVLISMVRRAIPQMIAYDICGVQPMTMPTGLIFAMKSRYTAQNGAEALFNEADSGFSGSNRNGSQSGHNPVENPYTTGGAMPTTDSEKLGIDSNIAFNQMAFSIEKSVVTAKTRALRAGYSQELAQDLQAVHGMNAEAELSNILTSEILNDINREIVRTIYTSAKQGAQVGTASQGTFDLDVDSNGRWSVEKFKGLMFQIEREANAIAQDTRRGRGNFIICSSDVASALAMAGVLDYTPALAQNNLIVDEASTTFAGILNGKYKVFVDPYAANQASSQFFVMGYKGLSAWDAGMFYCPYVALEKVRAIDPNSYTNTFAYRTRYGIVSNPFTTLNSGENVYYRRVRVTNLM